jgi:hypothetical protein
MQILSPGQQAYEDHARVVASRRAPAPPALVIDHGKPIGLGPGQAPRPLEMSAWGHKAKSVVTLVMSAFGSEADVPRSGRSGIEVGQQHQQGGAPQFAASISHSTFLSMRPLSYRFNRKNGVIRSRGFPTLPSQYIAQGCADDPHPQTTQCTFRSTAGRFSRKTLLRLPRAGFGQTRMIKPPCFIVSCSESEP